MKTIVLFLALLSTLFCKAQPDDMLFYYTWQLSQINIDGQTEIPFNDEINNSYVYLNFYDTTPYTFTLKVCKTLSCEIEYPSGNIMVFPSELSVSGDACNLSVNNDFEALLFSFFQNHLNTDLDYAIGVVDFEPPNYYPIITAPNGDWVEFHEALLSTEDFNKKRFSVFPNPVTDKIQARNLDSQKVSEMRLLSLQGSILGETESEFIDFNTFEMECIF